MFPTRLVNRKQSEGFKLLDRLMEELGDFSSVLEGENAVIYCVSILSQLPPLLRNGSASVHDQNESGATPGQKGDY